MCVDCDEDPTVMDAFSKTADWPVLPREGEGLDIGEGIEPATVGSVGYDVEGYPKVFLGRLVLDDLRAVQLRRPGRSRRASAPTSSWSARGRLPTSP